MSAATNNTSIRPKGAVLPPPAPGVRYVRVPLVGVVVSDDELRASVDHRFHWPMILLALAVLPLLAIELFRPPEGWMRVAVEVGFAIVWFAFVIEFIIKITIAECRVEYIRRNWLDLIIIMLPALRLLRVARAGSSLARTSRVFRLRGIGMKCARYVFSIVIGMEATDRLLQRIGIKPRSGRKALESMTRLQLMDELKKRRRLTDAWEAWYEAHREYVEHHGGWSPGKDDPTPANDVDAADPSQPAISSPRGATVPVETPTPAPGPIPGT